MEWMRLTLNDKCSETEETEIWGDIDISFTDLPDPGRLISCLEKC